MAALTGARTQIGGMVGDRQVLATYLGDTLVWTAGGGEVVPVTFDALGEGASVSTSSTPAVLSWSHTASGNAVLVFMTWARAVVFSAASKTVTYGSEAMTALGIQGLNNAQPDADPGFFIEVFGLLDPPTGPQTVTATVDHASGFFAASANSLSYNNVGSFGSITQDGGGESGTALSQTVSSAANRRVVQAFMVSSGVIGSYNQTNRWTPPAPIVAIVGDAEGDSTVTFTATRGNSVDYAELAIDLLPE